MHVPSEGCELRTIVILCLSCTYQLLPSCVCSYVCLKPLEIVDLCDNSDDVMILRDGKVFRERMDDIEVISISSASSDDGDGDDEVDSSSKSFYGETLREFMARRYYRRQGKQMLYPLGCNILHLISQAQCTYKNYCIFYWSATVFLMYTLTTPLCRPMQLEINFEFFTFSVLCCFPLFYFVLYYGPLFCFTSDSNEIKLHRF